MQYTLRHPPRSKRITLKVEYPDKVIVSAPRLARKKTIDRFVDDNQIWIQNQIQKLESHHDQVESNYQIMIFGLKYRKILQSLNNSEETILINNQDLIINLPNGSAKKTIGRELKHFLKKTARYYLHQRTPQLAKQLSVNYRSLKLKEQKTRWGSCRSQDNINLNWRLVHYPPAIIDYVIIHELAHLVHRNHSKNFWQLVSEHDPDYKQHRRYLKKFGVTHN